MQVRKANSGEIPRNLLALADPSEKSVNDYIERGICFLLEEGSKIKGVMVLLPTRPHTIEIVNIAVEEQYQDKGLGKYMLNEAFKIAKLEGYTIIEIGTGNSSLQQLFLYQKCGFRITGIDKDFFIKHYDSPIFENGIQCCDMIRLSKDL